MAKVQPLLTGRTKFNWQNRLTGLIKAIGEHVIEMGDDRTNRVHLSFRRLGMRLAITTRYWGRNGNHDVSLLLYGRKSEVIMATRNWKLTSVNSLLTKEGVTDYKAIYKLLERRVYAMFSGDHAAEIMSIGDTNYDILENFHVAVQSK